jgi:CheY-like chemotaxis protein
MNLNIAICDDDTNDIAIMKKNILQYTIETDNNIVVSSYFSASDLLSDYKNHLYQIVLLDIEMPDINGMELANGLHIKKDDLKMNNVSNVNVYYKVTSESENIKFYSLFYNNDGDEIVILKDVSKELALLIHLLVLQFHHRHYYKTMNKI